jgi:hypothetical protein
LRLVSPRLSVGTGFQMSLTGLTGATCRVQSSVNLSQWTTLATPTVTNAVMPFLDPQAGTSGRTFYCVVQP